MVQVREVVGRSLMFLKILQVLKKNPVLESLFNKVIGLKKTGILSKRDSSTGVETPVKVGKFLRTPFSTE